MMGKTYEFKSMHASSNPIYRLLIRRFYLTINDLLSRVFIGNLHILDVGCGEGFVLRYLQREHQSLKFSALDLNPRHVRMTKHLSPDVWTIHGNIYNMPIQDDAFDGVLVNEILEHLEDPHRALTEVKRVAGEYVICSVPDEPFFSFGNLIRGAYWTRGGRTPAHVNFWSRRTFRELMLQYFEVCEIKLPFPWIMMLCKV